MSIVNEKKSELNERQLEAVNTVKGPVVIIARLLLKELLIYL